MCVRVLVLAACLVLTTPAAALAQLRLAPDWAETPDGERLSHHYPLVAERLALEGRALLSCRVTIPTGVLKACAVVEEQPKGLGFGEAAMAMTRDFQMRAAGWGGTGTRTTPSASRSASPCRRSGSRRGWIPIPPGWRRRGGSPGPCAGDRRTPSRRS
ncbi:energy transducer TonB [Phenylobacterium sp. J367]|uniref:energy transducer TonB n=1 Tax=Phenylobacterium sp. J367 TaxID=2898435 RepID=UPI002151348D|nr:energy transducer TonB [Phenylobacterium sp. J367]MCR5878293.1 energy transducer TonB [Phenylobacterium sp. J367]